MEKTAWRHLRRLAIKGLIARLRDGPCALCGGRGGAHQFHHLLRVAPKRFDIGDAPRRTLWAVREELARTALLCPGCHAGIHAGRLDDSGLVPLASPVPDVWYAAPAFLRRYTYTASTTPAVPQRGPGFTDRCPGPPLEGWRSSPSLTR